jgi:hypothetical protein
MDQFPFYRYIAWPAIDTLIIMNSIVSNFGPQNEPGGISHAGMMSSILLCGVNSNAITKLNGRSEILFVMALPYK